MFASASSNEWRDADKLSQLASNTVSRYSPDLAQDFLLDVRRFANAAIAENGKRGDSLVQVPPAGGPTVATDAN